MSIIVTNAKNRISYAVIRGLAEKNLKVITADTVNTAMSIYSKYSSGHFIYPSPYKEPLKFLASITANCKIHHAEVLIPVYEETFLISKYKRELANHVNLLVPDYEDILQVHNKKKLYEIAEEIGIKAPRTYAVKDLKGDPGLLDAFEYPVLIKPNQGGGAWAIERVPDASSLRKKLSEDRYPHNLTPDRFLVQEVIEGQVYCCGILMKEGKFRAGHCYKQLRETPITGGTATYRESVIQPQIMQSLTRLLEHLRWNGVCQADFIIDRKSLEPFIIDANPRLWGSVFQGIVSGINFPYLIYKLAKNEDFEPIHKYDTRFRTRWVSGDIKCFIEALKARSNVIEFFKIRHNDRYDDFNPKDPLPFIMWFVDYLSKMVKQRALSPEPHDSLEGIWE